MRTIATARMAVAVALIAAGLAACEPQPRLLLEVTSTAMGPDDSPGDGVCASAVVGGACTLLAAIQEANAPTSASM